MQIVRHPVGLSQQLLDDIISLRGRGHTGVLPEKSKQSGGRGGLIFSACHGLHRCAAEMFANPSMYAHCTMMMTCTLPAVLHMHMPHMHAFIFTASVYKYTTYCMLLADRTQTYATYATYVRTYIHAFTECSASLQHVHWLCSFESWSPSLSYHILYVTSVAGCRFCNRW